ncbi:MAG: CBS domain-containing protein [Ktedonobacteraceae bacterium]|nr:CBS domain-containing protein [Ktedonobacteraceae bacterium]
MLVVHPDDTLDEALEQLTSHRVSWAPVVDVDGHSSTPAVVIGTLSAASIVRLYRETLAKDSRRMRGLIEGTVMIEAKIGCSSTSRTATSSPCLYPFVVSI